MPDKTYEKSNTNPKTKLVETIINDKKVIGKGTINNPWIFVPLYKATITSNIDNTISLNNNTYSKVVTFNFYFNDEKVIYLNESTYKYRHSDEECKPYIRRNGSTLIFNNSIGSFNCNLTFAKELNILFNKQGGTGGVDSTIAFINEKLPSITVPTKSGYTFDGYYSEVNGGGTKYYNADGRSNKVWDKTSGATLYANWVENTYTLTYNANGGSVSPSNKKIAYNAEYGTLPTPTKSGYIFDGWYTASSGGTKVSSTTKMGASNKTIYANWQQSCGIDGYAVRDSYKCSNITVGSAPYTFTYTGNCEMASSNDEIDGNDSWKVKFTTNGNLTFNSCISTNFETDIFVVGGGAYKGAGGYASTYSKVSIIPGTTYNVTIGSGGTSSSTNGGESSIKKNGTKLYFASGAQGSNGGSGKGKEGGFTSGCWECEWGTWTNGENGSSYGNNGGASTGQLSVAYNATSAPWGGQTTCEFNEGTSSGCKRGDNFAYSSASGGCQVDLYSNYGSPGNGLRGENSGAGGNCGRWDTPVEEQNGRSGVVIIRRKILKDWQINYKCTEGELMQDKPTGNIICVKPYTSTTSATRCPDVCCNQSGDNFCCCWEEITYHCNNGWNYYSGSGSGTKCYKAAQLK